MGPPLTSCVGASARLLLTMLARLLTPRNVAWALLLAALAFVYFGEWVEVTRNGGYSADATRNRHLAAEQFLAEFGVVVRASDGLQVVDELPPTNETLLVASSRRGLSERRVDSLLDWVRRGGRLILFALDFWDPDDRASGDALLDSLGVRLLPPEAGAGATVGESQRLSRQLLAQLRNQDRCGTGQRVARIRLADESQDLVAALSAKGYLELAGDYEYAYAANALGPQLLYIDVGEGAVVALTSLDLWTNRQIHCHDHAHLLRWLTEDRPVLWWLFNTQMPPLPVMVWQKFPVLVCLSMALLALWLWRCAVRLQKVRPAPDPARRELAEHLDGIARFFWQQGEDERLLGAWRRELLQGGALSEERIEQLAERSGVAKNRVRWAMTSSAGRDHRRFLAISKTLYDLHNSER